jgi:hypothetical protein
MITITKNDYNYIKEKKALEQKVIVKGARIVNDKTWILTNRFIYEANLTDKITIDKKSFVLNKSTYLYEGETDKDQFGFETKIENIFIDLCNN